MDANAMATRSEAARGPGDAELLVYTALRRLPDAYQIFVNPRINRSDAVDTFDHPLSFVIVHPDKGVMAIGMKIGEIVEETSGLLSQYQPHRQLYKIMDPVKQAKTAYEALASDCDPDLKAFVPLGVIAVFPDTQRVEFAEPKSNYFFKDSLDSARFVEKLEEIFPDPPLGMDSKRIRTHLESFCAYLKSHSDHHFELRDRTRVTPVARTTKQPPPPPKAQLPKGVHSAAKKPPTAPSPPYVAPAKPDVTHVPKVRQALQAPRAVSSSAPTAARRPASPSSAPVSPPMRQAPAQTRPVAHPQWQQVPYRAEAGLSPAFWIGVVCVAAGFIAAVYFLFRNIGGGLGQ